MSKQLHVVPSIECNAARRLLAMTRSSSLIGTDKQELMCRLNDKVDLGEMTDDPSPVLSSSGSAGPGSGGLTILAATQIKTSKPSQELKHIHNYGAEQLWGVICSQSASMETKLTAMAIFLKKFGVRFIAEQNSDSGLGPVQALQYIA